MYIKKQNYMRNPYKFTSKEFLLDFVWNPTKNRMTTQTILLESWVGGGVGKGEGTGKDYYLSFYLLVPLFLFFLLLLLI